MSTASVQREKSSFERAKDKLLSSSALRLPKFLTNEPAAPARYCGKPISPGYVSRHSGEKEQWYVPPDSPPVQKKGKKSAKGAPRSRASEPVISTPYQSRQNNRQYSEQLNGLLSPRVSSAAAENYDFPAPTHSADSPDEASGYKPLVIRDLRHENRTLQVDDQVHSGLLYDLIQTISTTWLPCPKIKESFIPLLRPDQTPIQEKAPTPAELRLIEGFLGHLPELQIITAKRIPRRPPNNTSTDFKRCLNLTSDVFPYATHRN
jgi:hypothetical protein